MRVFWRSKWVGVSFLLPQLVLVLLFFIWPMFRVCRNAFYYVDPFGVHTRFAGWQNIKDVLTDPSYYTAIETTAWVTLWVVLLTTALGLLIALLLHQVRCAQTWYKVLLLWPYAVAPAIAAVLWRFFFHPTLGWLSVLLAKWHVTFNYLIHPKQALALVVLVSVWQQVSYNVLFFFVSLEAIPRSIIEASMLDGASSWQRFWKIRLPMLKSTLLFLVLMNALYAFFETFSIIDILTAGGPGNRTTTLLYKLYKDGFVGMDWSSAAVQSLFMMLVVIGITLVQFQYDNQRAMR
ncbi:MAG: ABC transporter permease subunit [Gammaproteobacteria bacterium]|nr:ABC transporter permease subunit [Gammaproteobacteria bacterium]